MTFRAVIRQSGKTATGFRVPEAIVTALGAGKRPPVRVTINGYTYRSTVAVMGGVFMIGVSADVREKASVAGGEAVDIALELDKAPRVVIVPLDLEKALKSSATARKHFDALSYSKKQWLVLPIESAKTPETRQRRVEKALTLLKEGRV